MDEWGPVRPMAIWKQNLLFLVVLYFLPTIIAAFGSNPHLGRFFVKNVFYPLLPFGWCVMMWKALRHPAVVRETYYSRKQPPAVTPTKITFVPCQSMGGAI